MSENAVSVVLPVRGYTNVVRLIAAGFASQLEFGFAAIDDLQLAIDLILDSVPVAGESVTVTFATETEGLRVMLETFEEHTIEQRLRGVVRDGIDLGTFLGRLVESVDVLREPSPALVLHKRLEAGSV